MRLDRITTWQSRQDPVLELGTGRLHTTDDYAILKLRQGHVDVDLEALTPQWWPILASQDGTVRYDGEIHHVEETYSYTGAFYELYCIPATHQ